MFLILQFPIVDSRPFLDQETGMLQRPNWPSPLPDDDFVRSFGAIRQRNRGGLPGWVGESEICEANRAVRFESINLFKIPKAKTNRYLSVQVVTRRFYSDGYSVGKYEIGFTVRPMRDKWPRLRPAQTEALLRYILKIPVTVPDPTGSAVHCPLWKIRSPLAHLYRVSTSCYPLLDCEEARWWVETERPAIYLELHSSEQVEFPYPQKTVPTKSSDLNLEYFSVPWQGLRVPLWVASRCASRWWIRERRDRQIKQNSRVLRMTLLRLHAERECLRRVLANIASGRISITPGSLASDRLQAYLNDATRRINWLERPNRQVKDGVDHSLAFIADEFVQPGTRGSTLAGLEKARLNIRRKVEDYFWQQLYAQLRQDVVAFEPRLLGELTILHNELVQRALSSGQNPTQDESIQAMATAKQAAQKKDTPKALKYLSKAGKLAFEAAAQIGLALLTEVLKKGIPL